jgi:serine/threonine protein kinase
VEERLGAGGFGTVFRAESGGELQALKLLALQDVGEWAEREVVALARVKHPNVVQLRGFWQWPERAPKYHVVVMEYVPGRRLDVWTGTENPSARRVLRLVLGVARGLAEAHRAKVVHRDVKEANIIVREPDGEAVLVDFGVSGCERASRVTRGLMPPGTVEYRSPEAWRFLLENEDHPEARYQSMPSDDIFALGVVLYWLLTDVLPFPDSDVEGVESLLARPPVAPHVRNPAVPEELSALCLRLLEKRPEARLNAEAVCKAVEELLTREGAAWDGPLCEFFSEHNVTTMPDREADEEAGWLNEMRQAEIRPRRGQRPPLVVEASSPVAPKPVPVADAAPPAPVISPPQDPVRTVDDGPLGSVAPEQLQKVSARAAPPERSAQEATELPLLPPPPPVLVPALSGAVPASMVELRLRISALGRWGRMATGLALVMTLSAFASRYSALLPLPSTTSAPTAPARVPENGGTWSDAPLPTWEGGWKVAYPLSPPEARRSGLIGFEEAVPVPVAPTATLEGDDASVKIPQQKQRGFGAVKKAIATAGACTALGCPGTQVRPPPESKPCPPGAVEAMKARGIRVGGEDPATLLLDRVEPRRVTVSGSWINVRPVGYWRALSDRQGILSGELIIGERRVYVRLTQARTEDGTFPVCMELWDREGGGRGLIRKDDGGPNAAQVFSEVDLKAVDHFE